MRRRFCRSSRSGRARRALVLLAAAVSSIAGSAATAAEQVAAVLKTHEVRFVYRSFVNVFACDELRNHIAVILRALGARDDVQVRINDCQIVVIPGRHLATGTARTATIPPIFFATATFDQRQTSTRARAGDVSDRGDAAGAGGDREGQVAPRPHLARDGRPGAGAQRPDRVSRRAQAGDVVAGIDPPAPRALRAARADDPRAVFRELDIKVVSKQLSCDRYGRSRLAPKLTVEVLWPVGTPLPGEKRREDVQGISCL